MTNTLEKVLDRKPLKRAVARPVQGTDEVRAVVSEVVSESNDLPAVKVKALEATGKAIASPEAIARRNRRTKSPVNGRRNIMTVKGLAPGMIGRWVDNDPDRVDALMEHGYEPVRKPVQVWDISIDSGQQMGATVTKRVGGGKEAILMQIPKEWYDADQKEKQKIVDARETATKQDSKNNNFYGNVVVDDIVPGKRPVRRGVEE
jgi:hypothetical protein